MDTGRLAARVREGTPLLCPGVYDALAASLKEEGARLSDGARSVAELCGDEAFDLLETGADRLEGRVQGVARVARRASSGGFRDGDLLPLCAAAVMVATTAHGVTPREGGRARGQRGPSPRSASGGSGSRARVPTAGAVPSGA